MEGSIPPVSLTYPSVSLSDTFIVILYGFIGAALSEGCSWYFVYRKEDYQSVLEDVNRSIRRLDKQKEKSAKSIKAIQKTKAQEEQLQKKSQSLSFKAMKAQLFSSVLYFLIVAMFNRAYQDIVVAQLPFEPKLLFRSLAHRGLTTFRETDCSAMYLYVLSIGFFRTNLQKLVGAAPIKSASSTAPESGFASLFVPPEQKH